MRTTTNLQRSLRYLLAWAPTVTLARAMPAQRPVPDAALESGMLSFVGRATTGDFVGTTSRVTGAVIGGRDYSTTRGWITHVTSRFPIDLVDYQISGLTKMFGLLRMEREVDVRVDLRFMDTPTLWAIP